MDTDNPVIVRNTLNSPTIVCVQRKAEKVIPTEEDIINANKLAFNDDIGIVTNHVTSMIEVQAGFEPGTKEYETLAYRIMCGQLYQQNTIDRAKGIIAKPMPEYWYSIRDNVVKDGDDEDTIQEKNFNMKITAANKPYFMTYVYPSLRSKNNAHLNNNDFGVARKFAKYGICTMDELRNYEPKTQEMIDCISDFDKRNPVGSNPCVVNRICHIFENKFNQYLTKKYVQPEFDYRILKSNVSYSKKDYNEILSIYKTYQQKVNDFVRRQKTEKIDTFDAAKEKKSLSAWFRKECEQICTNGEELCDIVLDICYRSEKSKQFAWDICGETILHNVLRNNNYCINFPVESDGEADFEYGGKKFVMREKYIGDNDDSVE